MKEAQKAPVNIDEYISRYPGEIQLLMEKVRLVISEIVPEAVEKISYSMPAFTYYGMLVYFAAHQNHIGFYPMASGIAKFKKEIEKYTWSKGTVQFPYDKPLPIALIKKMVKFRASENLEKWNDKKNKKVNPTNKKNQKP